MENEIGTKLVGRQKLIYEAVLKIQQGEALARQGKIELDNLTEVKGQAKKKTVANRTLRSTFKVDKRTDQDIANSISRMVGHSDKITVNWINQKLGVGERRTLRIINQMPGMVFKDGDGGARYLVKKTEVKKKVEKEPGRKKRKSNGPYSLLPRNELAKPGDPIDKVRSYIKNNSWVTQLKLTKGIQGEFYAIRRCVNTLLKDKEITIVRKRHNPAHKDLPASYAREYEYFETT